MGNNYLDGVHIRTLITGSNPVLTTKPKSILHEHWLTAWKDKQNSQVAELVDATVKGLEI